MAHSKPKTQHRNSLKPQGIYFLLSRTQQQALKMVMISSWKHLPPLLPLSHTLCETHPFLWGLHPHTCEQCFTSLLTMCSQSIILPSSSLCLWSSQRPGNMISWIMETFSVQCHRLPTFSFPPRIGAFMSPMLSQPMGIVCCTVLKVYIFKLHRALSSETLRLCHDLSLFLCPCSSVVFIFLE